MEKSSRGGRLSFVGRVFLAWRSRHKEGHLVRVFATLMAGAIIFVAGYLRPLGGVEPSATVNNYIENKNYFDAGVACKGSGSDSVPAKSGVTQGGEPSGWQGPSSLELASFLRDKDGFGRLISSLVIDGSSLTWDSNEVLLDHVGYKDVADVWVMGRDNVSMDSTKVQSATCADIRGIHIKVVLLARDDGEALEATRSLFGLPDVTATDVHWGTDGDEAQPYESDRGLSFEVQFDESIHWRIEGSLHQIDTCQGMGAYDVYLTLNPYADIMV